MQHSCNSKEEASLFLLWKIDRSCCKVSIPYAIQDNVDNKINASVLNKSRSYFILTYPPDVLYTKESFHNKLNSVFIRKQIKLSIDSPEYP